MNNQAKTTRFVLVASLLSMIATPAIQAFEVPSWAKYTAVGLTAAAVLRFHSKKGHDSEHRAVPSDLLDLENLPTNAWYLVDDMIIGHSEKKQGVVGSVDEDTKKIEWTVSSAPSYKARGLGGFISTHWKSVESTTKTLGTMAIIYVVLNGRFDLFNPMKIGDCKDFNKVTDAL